MYHADTLYGLMIFLFHDTATTEIYTLSLHDALPICHVLRHPDPARNPQPRTARGEPVPRPLPAGDVAARVRRPGDRKSTRLNSSHSQISYAVFCLKKKKRILTGGRDLAILLLPFLND